RLWLPLDFDPIKPAGVSSTDAEKAAAKTTAVACLKFLKEQGWPHPIIADSGNGYHVLFAIDLPNDEPSKALLKKVFESLAARFNNDRVKFDMTNFNAARIFKLYGTIAGKGDELPDRPHRLSRLLKVHDLMQPLEVAQLEAVAKLKPEGPRSQAQ